MYSLYRAWLMRDAVAAATLATPADVVVNVGGSRQFAAHRAVLATHSGYLKALLSSSGAGSENAMSISVPNVSPEAFAPLLTFMYTGYLDVTHDNIYGVLLATHLLHMPRALDLCRAFLVQNQQQPRLPTLVKPIPSRKMLPMLLPPGPYWPPPGYHTLPPPAPPPPPPHMLLPSADNSPFRSILPEHPLPQTELVRSKSPLAVPSTSSSRKRQSPSPPSSVSPCLSGTSLSSDDRHVISTSPQPPRASKKSLQHKGGRKPVPSSSSSTTTTTTTTTTTNNNNNNNNNNQHEEESSSNGGSKVIIDVACCDGPVRFHRVLNDNYGLALDDIVVSEPAEENKEDEEEEDKNSKVSSSGSGDTVYTCLYCNHTFKSHYCYQKHARRHINPVTLDLSRLTAKLLTADKDKSSSSTNTITTTTTTTSSNIGVRREVRLLDMNVQYYPCKTCGSKFPSYYFVHKHRKMCHANEETDSVVSSEESHSQSQTATV
ncbi:zinc finger and BTB domain-containing protein 42 [Anabrus simplex]|uniref:zinc finger and BTB domain-containing protein 42 n=1 Tax=Anabrus simplex TaxID=316456 RepID=UPI0035A2F9FB